MTLPSKAPGYGYPRDVQSEVWKKWFDIRNEKNVILKMNTGSGKTVVGLIMLQSCLNEEKGPAIYLSLIHISQPRAWHIFSATSFSVPLEEARSKFAVNILVVILHSSLPTISQGQVSSSFSTQFRVNCITRPAIFSHSSPESPVMPPSQLDFSQSSGMLNAS